jgi:hypothetical protein
VVAVYCSSIPLLAYITLVFYYSTILSFDRSIITLFHCSIIQFYY